MHKYGGDFLGILQGVTLNRILSLIPKKENGEYLHGAKKAFAESIGYKGGEIITMWENGDSKSYMGKLYEISSVHNVSIEWLRGETDDPTPARQKESSPQIGELTEDELRLVMAYRAASEKKRANLLGLLEN